MADENLAEVPENLSKWFTHDEWKQLSYYEKKRTLNVLENYHTLTGLGINVPKPDFMYPTLHKFPRNHTQKIPDRSTNKVTEGPKEKGQYSFRDDGEVSTVQHNRRKHVTYELRQRKSKSYREDSSSDDDDYLFCDECNKEWFSDCPSHGPLIHVMDTQVPVYPLDPERAAKTLPSIFRIGPSAIRKAGLGVWTTTSLLPRTVFGPYEGVLTDTANEEGYCWLVRENGRPSGFIDASNSSISNWMRFVNCSRHEKEQNLVAFQYKRKIYYRTTRLILPNVELLVWYGEEFDKVLGIDKKKYHVAEQCSGDVYRCSSCRLTFATAAYRDRHHPYCRGRWNTPWKANHVVTSNSLDGEIFNESNRGRDSELRYCSATSYTSKIEDNTKHIVHIEMKPCTDADSIKDVAKYNHLAKTFTNEYIYSTNVDTLKLTDDIGITLGGTDNGGEDKKCSETSKGCNISLYGMSNINNQELIHSAGQTYKWSNCNKTFDQATELEKHKPHTGEQKCTIYNKASSNLHTHERIHTGERPYKCTTCNKAFLKASNLHTHERIHTGERPYKCTTCNKAFSQASELLRHERIHTGERPYKCTTCNKAFSDSSYLQRHERIHTGERPYKCTTCNKAFSGSSELHRHERIHTGERPYKCTTCNKAFSDSSYLQRHERIHTGDRPYKCTTCNKAFSGSSELHRHERIHTGECPYKCTTRNKAFSAALNLRS